MAAAPGDVAADPILTGAVVFLGAAVVAVPLFKRLGLGSVLGYLAAGALIGPHVLGVVSEAENIRHVAEFGVVLLLFVIGLELRPQRLWRMRMEIFGLGLAQVGATSVLLAASIWLVMPLGWAPSIAIGAALALSSTAFAIQILRDRGELTTPHGDRAFSILLFQDMAIVPLLALVAFLGSGSGGEEGDAAAGFADVAIGLGAIAGVVVVGRYGLRPLFRIIALTRTDEIFTAAALLVVAASALAMQMAGLSMALGAFIAGVLLAESEFRHQLEADIEPFRGLFLGLFFMSVGMGVVWPVVFEWWWLVILGALILYAGKAAFIWLLTRAAGSTSASALRIAALLGQGGEFGFVILGFGAAAGLWERETGTIIAAIVVLTMVMTPLAVIAADRITEKGEGGSMDGIDEVDAMPHGAPVIIAGFGRFGQVVARVLKLRGYEVTLIDKDPERIRIAESFDNKVYFGDLRRSDVLKMVGAEEARAIFLCGDDADANAKALEKLRARLPQTPIFCRAADRFEENRLERLGATGVVREMLESAVLLAREALEELGDGSAADDTIQEFRRRDEELLKLQAEHGAKGGFEKMRAQFSLDDER
ncbi:MAG: monovalent cation:proton antiporter-2 (CPA2) family protein [Pseudomonadota bacterium]